jgi:hypothetical protein
LLRRVEQGAQAAVHQFAHVDVVEQVLVFQLHGGDLLLARVDQDVEVLAHLLVLFLRALARNSFRRFSVSASSRS